LTVGVGGTGTVAHAGVVLPRLLGDRTGLTRGLSVALARVGFIPGRDRGRALVDAAAALAAGASCLTDIEAMTRQVEIFGPGGGASDSTLLRILDELGAQLAENGLPRARVAKAVAEARGNAWAAIVARHGDLPAVSVAGRPLVRTGADGSSTPITVVRIDATLIDADSEKQNAAGTYKGGFGFHPLAGWCTNVGDNLVIMNRPGNAGSSTGTDHVAVLKAAFAQLPAAYRADVLVTIDGAGASHEVIDHLHALNTARVHGRRGRVVEYSIGWPVDARTRSGIEAVPAGAWTPGLGADGDAEHDAHVVELTGLLRHGPDGDALDGWPVDVRIFVRRLPRPAGAQAELGEDPRWRYGAFVTNTTTGQAQFLDARHRTQAHVEDDNKDLKTCGGANLPSKNYARNSAWLLLAALAVTLTAWLRHIALDGDLAKAAPKTLRYRIFSAPARLVTHARTRVLKVPPGWAWAPDLAAAWDRLHAVRPA
jgi:hypothetical protein